MIHVSWAIDDFEPAIIVCHKTGIIYNFQVGGKSCNNIYAEGFIIPLSFTSIFVNFKYRDCELGCWGGEAILEDGMKVQCLKYINEISKLITHYSAKFEPSWEASIDMERIEELQEGWWPINLKYYNMNYKAYIHIGNCD